jgi:hypothetical protein
MAFRNYESLLRLSLKKITCLRGIKMHFGDDFRDSLNLFCTFLKLSVVVVHAKLIDELSASIAFV